MLVAIRGGGIRRRLMMWGLSLFGIALTVVVVASYSYTVSQIKKDAAELQIEIASVTAERIRDFVQRKIERFSDTADAVSLYPLGSKEQQLLVALLVKNDSQLYRCFDYRRSRDGSVESIRQKSLFPVGPFRPEQIGEV